MAAASTDCASSEALVSSEGSQGGVEALPVSEAPGPVLDRQRLWEEGSGGDPGGGDPGNAGSEEEQRLREAPCRCGWAPAALGHPGFLRHSGRFCLQGSLWGLLWQSQGWNVGPGVHPPPSHFPASFAPNLGPRG